MQEIFLGDVVRMRKPHPCGNDLWTVTRTGADIKIKCHGCGRIVMLDRADFVKRMKKLISRENHPTVGSLPQVGIPSQDGSLPQDGID